MSVTLALAVTASVASAAPAAPASEAPAPKDRRAAAGPIPLAQGAATTEAAALSGHDLDDEDRDAPPYRLLRADEDYRYLRDPTRPRDLLDHLKYIPLGKRVALGFGGETRQRMEWFNNGGWGDAPPRTLSWLQRYMVHVDLRVPHARFFVQLKSALERGRIDGPRPIDRDDLDFHQAFADLEIGRPDKPGAVVRVGRHELAFGSGRLVSPREGPNVRRSFDGVSLLVHGRQLQTHLFVARPVAIVPGVFDDGWEPRQWFAGAHFTAPSPHRGGSVDVYAFYLDRPDVQLQRGTGHERRLSLGTRWSGTQGPLDYNAEAVLQTGSFAGRTLLAWTLASDTGVTAPLPWQPRLGVRADIASGDRGGARPVGTFQALFPKGSYFGEDALIGPANLFDIHPSLGLEPLEHVRIDLDWVALWRHSLADGVYNVPGEPSVGPVGDARFIGHRAGASLAVELERHVGFVVTWSRFFRGPFLVQAGKTRDVDFVATWMTLKF